MSVGSEALAERAEDDARPDRADVTGPEAARQFVTFFLDQDRFAFPMERVREIIRMPRVVGVPLAPPDVLGLTNLRGAILPVRDLRTLLGLPVREADDLSRTIVIDAGDTVGLVVDRVASVLSLPDSQISAPDGTPVLGEALRQGILKGVARNSDTGALIQIIDPVAALSNALAGEVTSVPDEGSAAGSGIPSGPGTGAGPVLATSRQIVCFDLDGQEYALALADVAEIVRPPDTLFRVPMTRDHVLGVMHLRNALLPVLGLRRLLGLPDLPVSDTNRIIVLRLEGSDGMETTVGMIVDQVREVLDVPDSALVAITGVGGDETAGAVETMCRLDEGRRLIGILSARKLLADPGLRAAMAHSVDVSPQTGASRSVRHVDGTGAPMPGAETMQHHDTGKAKPVAAEETLAVSDAMADETQLVVFQLGGQEFGVEIAHVLEIIRVPSHIVSVPRAPAGVEGVINLRGSILPVVALRVVFGLPTTRANDRARIVVLSIGGSPIGYVVDSVTEVLRVPHGVFETPCGHGGPRVSVIGRIARLNGGERLVQIVDTTALPGTELADQTLGAAADGGEDAAHAMMPA